MDKKNSIITAYYNACFYAKSQSKGGLSNNDLDKVLNAIDGKNGTMTDAEMFEVMKTML
jgi:hypothetical protein